jgi:hypothetical protein
MDSRQQPPSFLTPPLEIRQDILYYTYEAGNAKRFDTSNAFIDWALQQKLIKDCSATLCNSHPALNQELNFVEAK